MISRSKLDSFLQNRWGIIGNLADDQYSLPAREWLTGDFAMAFKSVLFELNFKYSKEKRDCDKFNRLAAAYAALLHSKMGNETGLAFGEFWYTRRDGERHAINCFASPDKELAYSTRDYTGELMLRFFEPQNQTEVYLTDEEIMSCYFCRF